MVEALVLGAIQGTAEWLPISSEGAIIVVKNTFFPNGATLGELIQFALFLHLGTFFAALVYFRKDVATILKGLITPQKADAETRSLVLFLTVATLATVIVGGLLMLALKDAELSSITGRVLTALIGATLLVTAWLQWRVKRRELKEEKDASVLDALIIGFAQGFTVLPGLSRSGTTVALLLLRGVREETALRLSFLMSLPVVLGANILLNADALTHGSFTAVVALGTSFAFGLATIHGLMKLARRVNFASFIVFIAFITLVAALIG